MKLAVGDSVVYGTHGVGRVAAREHRTVDGDEQEVVVLELKGGLRVTLAVEQALERLRPLLSEADVKKVQQALRQPGAADTGGWLKRMKQSQAKLAGGDPLLLAEIVRDVMRRERSPGIPKLSEGERRLYLKARELLAREIASARGLEEMEADARIEEQLATAEP